MISGTVHRDCHCADARYKTYATEHEHRLGVWLHHQHQARTESTLFSWRLDALNEVVPGWRSRS